MPAEDPSHQLLSGQGRECPRHPRGSGARDSPSTSNAPSADRLRGASQPPQPDEGGRRVTTASTVGDTTPTARVDHVMVLLDGATHRDVASSAYLAERFARLRRKEAESSVAGRYSTLGVAGDATLVELFGTELPAQAPVTGGLVLSFEEPGSSPRA